MKQLLRHFLPPLVLALVLGLLFVSSGRKDLQESAISPNLPLDYELPGWHAVKQQESDLERTMLARDTRFSKAVYSRLRQSVFDKPLPPVHVSIVYSGSDMNASIHRPERCLPSQGHLELRNSSVDVRLDNGKTITFTRLTSRVPLKDHPGTFIRHLNYYVFVGRDRMCSQHLERTLYDVFDRTVKGVAQRWAYYQLGTCWGESIGVTEEEAETLLRSLISELTPGLVNWEAMGD